MPWKYYYTHRVGLSHEITHTPCQDAVCIKESNDTLVAVLADGLGSLKKSEIASQAVTENIAAAFICSEKNVFSIEIQRLQEQVLEHSRKAIQTAAYEYGLDASDMDCTLLFVCINKRSNEVIVGHLGDGAICIIHNDSAELFSPPNRQVANGTATVMCNSEGDFHFSRYNIKTDSIVGFILSSDGLENELYFSFGRVKKVAAEYFNALQLNDKQTENEIDRLISTITKDKSSVYDDDISIAILSKAHGFISLPEDINWLCQCGERNGLQHTWCPHCGCDVVALHDKFSYAPYGRKYEALLWLNNHPEEELALINEYKQRISRSSSISSDMYETESNTQEVETEGEYGVLRNNHMKRQKKNISSKVNPSKSKFDDLKLSSFSFKQVLLCSFVAFMLGILLMMCVSSCNNDTATDRPIASDTDQTEFSMPFTNSDEDIISLPDGEVYVGATLNGIPDGFGVYYKENCVDVGSSNNGNKHGLFVTVYSNGKVKYSLYYDGVRIDSSGIIPNTFVHSGDWCLCALGNDNAYFGDVDNDLPNGQGVYFSNNRYEIGTSELGIKQGVFVVVNQNGAISYITYLDGDVVEQVGSFSYSKEDEIPEEILNEENQIDNLRQDTNQ